MPVVRGGSNVNANVNANANANTKVPSSSSSSSTCLSATKEAQVEMNEEVAQYITQDNWNLLSARGQTALANLIKDDAGFNAQTHVYGNWPESGMEDEGKIQLAEQVSLFVIVDWWMSSHMHACMHTLFILLWNKQ